MADMSSLGYVVDMQINIDAREAIGTLAGLKSILVGPRTQQANMVGGRAVLNFLKNYHKEFAGARKWDNPSAPTWGPNRKRTRWGEDVSRAWKGVTASQDGAVVTNTGRSGLGLKIRGGPVTAKSAKYMTIPVDPGAHGRRAADFASHFGVNLFRPRGKDYLAINEDGVLKVIYLLREKVTHKQWPGAMPNGLQIADVFADAFIKHLMREIAKRETKRSTPPAP